MIRYSPFHLMLVLFLGLTISLVLGLVGAASLWYFGSSLEAQVFVLAYTGSFKTIISFGLILGTAMIVYISQYEVPQIIENAFTHEQLSETSYSHYKERFESLRRSISFSAIFIVVGWVIFWQSHFRLSRRGEILMIALACVQYGLGVYVGRKLIYIGMMLHSLLKVVVVRNLFKSRELDEINRYVNVVSTLTIIFVYINVIGYYGGPFAYDRWSGSSIRLFLLLPAVIATPVLLIFNFYPRLVLRKLYDESIDVEINTLKEKLKDEKFSDYEKRSYLIEFDRMSREQLRYSLQLTLSDLPIGITILIMVLEPLLRR